MEYIREHTLTVPFFKFFSLISIFTTTNKTASFGHVRYYLQSKQYELNQSMYIVQESKGGLHRSLQNTERCTGVYLCFIDNLLYVQETCPILYSKLLHKMGQDFLDKKYSYTTHILYAFHIFIVIVAPGCRVVFF